MEVKKAIETLGLNNNQSHIYLTILQMGSGQIQDIAAKSGIKRTTTYSILDILCQKGLVNLTQKGAHREYYAENPKKILNILEREVMEKQEQERTLQEILPELTSLYNAHATKPRIRTYEGIEGIKRVFEETLLLPKGSETLAYASYQIIHSYLRDYITNYIARRAKRGITQRCIAEDSPEARENLVKNDKRDLRETRLVDKDKFPFITDQINIFGNKMFIASYKDLLAVVIESAAVAETQRSIFELAWMGAKQMKNK